MHKFTFPAIVHKGYPFSITSITLVIPCLFDNTNSNIMVLICIPLIINDFEHPFLLAIFYHNPSALSLLLSAEELMLLNCGVGKDSWTARRSNQSILKEINPGISLEGMMLKLKLEYFGHLMQRVDSLENTLMLGGIGGRRRG